MTGLGRVEAAAIASLGIFLGDIRGTLGSSLTAFFWSSWKRARLILFWDAAFLTLVSFLRLLS